jgi:hypothetical protein
MIKQIKLKGNSLQIKIKCIIELCFGGCSDSELEVMTWLLTYSTGNTITLSTETSRQIKQLAQVGPSAFTTSLFRMEKKGLINRTGKVIRLHPAFNNLDGADKILISFEEIKESVGPVKNQESSDN